MVYIFKTHSPVEVKASATSRSSGAVTPMPKWFHDEKPIGGLRVLPAAGSGYVKFQGKIRG